MSFDTLYILHLCHHLEEGEGDDLLGDVDHLVEADSDGAGVVVDVVDGAGVVVDVGQEGGGQGHVRAGLPFRVHRGMAMLHVDCTCL